MKTKLISLITFMLLGATLSSCHDEPDYKNDIYGNFDALGDLVDSRY